MTEDPVGTLSLLMLANQWVNVVSTRSSRTSSGTSPLDTPFGALSSWIISCLDLNEGAWTEENVAKDTYGFEDWPIEEELE
jgi:hypothetical protein